MDTQLQTAGLFLAAVVPILVLEFRTLFRVLPWGPWTVKVTAVGILLGVVFWMEGSDLDPVLDVVLVSTLLFVSVLVLMGRRPTWQTPFDGVSVVSFGVAVYWVVIFVTTPPSLEFAGGTGAITIQGVPISWVVTSLVGMNATNLYRIIRRTLGWREPPEYTRPRPSLDIGKSLSQRATLAGGLLWAVALTGLIPIPSPATCAAGLCVQVTAYPLYGLTFIGVYLGISTMVTGAILGYTESQPTRTGKAGARKIRRPAERLNRT